MRDYGNWSNVGSDQGALGLGLNAPGLPAADWRLYRPAATPLFTAGFSPDAMIDTTDGPVPAREIGPQTRLLTRDSGVQAVLWAGRSRAVLGSKDAGPVQVAPSALKGALNGGADHPALIFPPHHHLLLYHPRNAARFGAAHVLVRISDLLHVPGVVVVPRPRVNWAQILLGQHDLLRVDGVWAESLVPNMHDLRLRDPETASEIADAAPKLTFASYAAAYVCRYITLNAEEAAYLDFS